MSINEIVENSWIPILFFAITLGYGIKIIVTKDPVIIKKELGDKVLKDSERYCTNAAYLMFGMSGASILMIVISYFTPVLATIFFMTVFFLIAFLWKKNENINGPL